jgi:hypothetical protein
MVVVLVNFSDNTCKVNSPISSSSSRSEEQMFSSQNLAEARKRTCRVLLQDYGIWVRLFIPHMQFLFECLGKGSSHYWRCSNWITKAQRLLGDSQIKQGKNFTGNFLQKFAKGMFANAVWKIQAQDQTNRPASRLLGRKQFIYRIPVTHARLEGSTHVACVCVCREKQAPDQENCEAVNYNILQKMWH